MSLSPRHQKCLRSCPSQRINVIFFRWSAVAKGAVIAVLKGTEDVIDSMPVVVSRVARFSYGVQFGYSPSNLKKFGQAPASRVLDEYYFDPDGTELVRRMTWYLKKVRLPLTALPTDT